MAKVSRFEAIPVPPENPELNLIKRAHIFGYELIEKTQLDPDASDIAQQLRILRTKIEEANEAPKYFLTAEHTPFIRSIIADSEMRAKIFTAFDVVAYLHKYHPQYLAETHLDKLPAARRDIAETKLDLEEGAKIEITSDDLNTLFSLDNLEVDEQDEVFALEDAIVRDVISDNLLLEILSNYVQKATQRVEDVWREHDQDMQYVRDTLLHFFSGTAHNKETLGNRLMSAQQQTTPAYIDGYGNPTMIWGPGTHHTQKREVQIDIWTDRETRRHALLHEYTHDVAGITATEAADGTTILRSGLAFALSDKRRRTERADARFTWLNEAVTEMIVMLAKGEDPSQDTGYYSAERVFLCTIVDSTDGLLSRQDFFDAYFEDYDSDAHGVSKWKQLNQKITSAYGPGFLMAVDKYVAKPGNRRGLPTLGERLRDGSWKELLAPYRTETGQ
jgi:hypothetical protein